MMLPDEESVFMPVRTEEKERSLQEQRTLS